jgi:hypothetical protein
MLELSVFCVILIAAGYWATLFIMGRRDDVIHGKFVHVEDEPAFERPARPLAPPPFPKRPVRPAAHPREPVANDAQAKPVTSETLQSLLVAIQQDLKSVA